MSYSGNNPKDITITDPPIATAIVSDLDDAERQGRRAMIYGFAAVTTIAAATYTVLDTDHLIICTASGPTITLPLIANISTTSVAREFIVANNHASASLTITPTSPNTCPIATLLAGERVIFFATGGSAWVPFSMTTRASYADNLLGGGAYRVAATAAIANTIVLRDGNGAITGSVIGTPTVNHDMTGPITGTGNVTSITAQTGTGTTFVMNTNPTISGPTLTAPVLGTPASGNLANCTFPTFNQNTSGSSATATNASGTGTAVYSGELGLKIIRGEVSSSGSLENGTGFTPTRNDLGYYAISYTSPFNGYPSIVVTPVTVNGGTTSYVFQQASGSCVIAFYNTNSSNLVDVDFHFIAIGPK